MDQVNTAVAQMDKVTQSNAATAEEAASAAEELSAQAAALNGMVEDLVSMVEGGARTNNGHPAPAGPRAASSGAKRVMQVRRVESLSSSSPAPRSAGMKMLPASEVIPLDEADDF